MQTIMLVALMTPACSAAGMLGANGHGIRQFVEPAEPVCCSQSAESGCVTTHPCRAVLESETDPEALVADFRAWLIAHGKRYVTVEEWAHRLTVFSQNARTVAEHDADAEGWSMSVEGQFADLSASEFSERNRLTSRAKPSQRGLSHSVVGSQPVEKDWRSEGIVTPVKNQGSCGSCWTFSTVVSIEGAHATNTGKLVSLSEQSLVDCVTDDVIDGGAECCDGCQGGLMDNAFDYIISKHRGGVDTEASYPYTGKAGACESSAANYGAIISNWTDVTSGDEDELLDAVGNVGALSIALDASKQWQLYSGGVMAPRNFLGCSSDPNSADHGVAVVGYGVDGSDSYWWIKNSWGSTWGESGYMRLKRGVNACGIANFASYPVV